MQILHPFRTPSSSQRVVPPSRTTAHSNKNNQSRRARRLPHIRKIEPTSNNQPWGRTDKKFEYGIQLCASTSNSRCKLWICLFAVTTTRVSLRQPHLSIHIDSCRVIRAICLIRIGVVLLRQITPNLILPVAVSCHRTLPQRWPWRIWFTKMTCLWRTQVAYRLVPWVWDLWVPPSPSITGFRTVNLLYSNKTMSNCSAELRWDPKSVPKNRFQQASRTKKSNRKVVYSIRDRLSRRVVHLIQTTSPRNEI